MNEYPEKSSHVSFTQDIDHIVYPLPGLGLNLYLQHVFSSYTNSIKSSNTREMEHRQDAVTDPT